MSSQLMCRELNFSTVKYVRTPIGIYGYDATGNCILLIASGGKWTYS